MGRANQRHQGTPPFRSRAPRAGTALLLGPLNPGQNGSLHGIEFTFILQPNDTPQISLVCACVCLWVQLPALCMCVHVSVACACTVASEWVHWLPRPTLTDASCPGSRQFLSCGKRRSLRVLLAEPDPLVCVWGGLRQCCCGARVRGKCTAAAWGLAAIHHPLHWLRAASPLRLPCTGPLGG